MIITSKKYYDETANEYDDSYKNPYWQIYNEITWNYIKKYLPKEIKNSLILDAGGGTGLWSIKIAQLGYNVILTDISKGMLEVAKEKITKENLIDKIQVIEADIIDMNIFRNNSFDLALAEGDSVSYCNDPNKAIYELSRVTKRNGFITVSVDNKLNFVLRNINSGDFKEAEKILQTGIAMMPGKNNEEYPAYTFTIDEIIELFNINGIETLKTIGKPVFISNQDLNNKKIYKKLLEFELKFSSLPSVAGRGGHIAIIGIKK